MSKAKYPPNFIHEGRDFKAAWEEAVRFCLLNGLIIKPEENSKTLTYDMCSKITLYGGAIKQILNKELHPKFPTKEAFQKIYTSEYTREWVAEQKLLPLDKQFVYNYMDRFINEFGIDQVIILRDELRNGISRRTQMITWNAKKDLTNKNPPCLQRVWVRILNDDGDCEIHFDWRSRDLYGAWMSNYIGLFDMLNREIFSPLNLNVVKFVCNCNSLHIYQSDWEAAGKI